MAKPDLRGEPQGIVSESTSLPILAAAMVQNAAGTDGSGVNTLLNGMLVKLLQEEVANREKNQARREKMLLQNALSAKEAAEQKAAERANCSHRNQLNETRLRGQRLSGTGQINLLCTFCQESFFSPALPGQKSVPADLWPNADMIGG